MRRGMGKILTCEDGRLAHGLTRTNTDFFWFVGCWLLIVFSLTLVAAIPQTFNVHGKLSNSSGVPAGSYSMNFSIYDQVSGGSALFSQVTSVSVDSDGVYNVILKDIDLSFADQYYLGINVEEDGEMSPRMNLTSSAYSFRAGNVTSSGIIYDANVEVGGYNFSVGNGDLFVDNSTGRVGIGTTDPSYQLDIVGTGSAKLELSRITGNPALDGSWGIDITSALGGGAGTLRFLPSVATGDFNILNSGGVSRFFVDTSSGKVGIGTTTPQRLLHVAGDVLANGTINATDDVCVEGGVCLSTVGSSAGGWTRSGTVLSPSNAGDNVTVGGSDFVVDNTNGRVGVGTDSPQENLHILDSSSSFVETESTGANAAAFKMTNAYGSYGILSSGVEDRFNIYDYTDSAYRFTIDGGGNVGIGTTSPGSKLDVNGSVNISGSGAALVFPDGTSMTTAGGAAGSYVPYTGASSNVVLGDNNFSVGTSDLFVDNTNGRVGIGTTSPETPLDVTESYDTIANILSSGSYAAKFSSNSTGNTGRTQGILISAVDATSRGVAILAEAQSSSNDYDMILATSAASSTPTERMRIDSSGNVGIGTVSPGQELHILGSGVLQRLESDGLSALEFKKTSSSSFYNTWDADNSKMYFTTDAASTGAKLTIQADGRVGIGTTSPGSELDVNGSVNISGSGGALVFPDGTTMSTAATGSASSSAGWTNTSTTTSTDLDVNVGGGDLFVNSTSGNVGIGTVSPEARLEVISTDGVVVFDRVDNGYGSTLNFDSGGDTKWSVKGGHSGGNDFDFAIRNNTGDAKFLIKQNGNVGIGTASPSDKLNIVGGGIQINNTGNSASIGLERTDGGILAFGGAISNSAVFAFDEQGDFYIRSETRGDVRNKYFNRGDVRFAINGDSGNVGIGTTSPGKRLDVNAGTTNQVAIFNSTDDTVSIILEDDDTTAYWHAKDSTTSIGLNSGGLDSSNLVIDSSGNVGIGTTSPDYKLNVKGVTNTNQGFRLSAGEGTPRLTTLYNDESGIQMALYDGGGNTQNKISGVASVDTFFGGNNNVAIGATNAGTAKLYVDGDVGIGTTSPDSELEIAGAGIMLHLDSTGDAIINLDRSASNKQGHIQFETADSSNWVAGQADSDFHGDGTEFFIGTSAGTGGEKLWIETSGNVGIGTTSPGSKLDVNGSVNISGSGAALVFPDGTSMTTAATDTSESDPLWSGNYSSRTGTGNVVYSAAPAFTGDTSITGTSTSWGVSPSAGWKTTMGTGASATWLAYGESSGTFRGGIQLLDSGGSMRIYANTGYISIGSSGALTVPGGISTSGALNMNSNKITSLTNGTAAQDAVTYSQLQAVSGGLGDYVPLTGGTMTGRLIHRSDDGLYVQSSTNGVGAIINFSDQSSNSYVQNGWIQYKHSDGAVATGSNDGFLIGGTEATTVVRVQGRLDVDSSIYSADNVGIGTLSPASDLHIYDGAISNVANTTMLTLEGYNLDVTTTPQAIGILFNTTDGNSRAYSMIRHAVVNSDFYGDNDEGAGNLVFSTTDNAVSSDKMIITGRGDIGIGTVNPSEMLEISDGSKGLTFDPTVSEPTINTTSGNVTISSEGGSVIIKLG
jgi:hypothetical protein